MLIVLAACHKDIQQALEWGDWVKELGADYSNHSALVIGSSTIDPSLVFDLAQKFSVAGFKTVTPIRAKTEEAVSWPQAANAMWRLAAMWVKDNARTPWLWCESDAIPLKPDWLDLIEREYLTSKKAFLGTIYPFPYNHLNGIAVYPPNIIRHNPLMLNSEFFNAPFDTVRPDLTLRDAHITRLIWRGLADPATNTPHSFPDFESLSVIPPEAVLAHCCKDGSLIARLRDVKNPTQNLQAAKPTLIENVISVAKKMLGTAPYYHSGNLGDVCYALSAIKAAGGGELIIGPEQRKTAICSIPIDLKQFEMMKPLLGALSYIKKATFSQTYPTGVIDLNRFRNIWISRPTRQKYGIDTLCKAHYLELGILDKFNEEAPWLTCGKAIETGKLIVHRSPRYNAPATGAEAFPWQRLVDADHDEMLFVGLESEYDTFCRAFGKKVSFYQVKDFLELARVIKGGKCFIGNQSFPLSIAIGLGKRVICESCPRSPDTRFKRENYQDQLIGKVEL